jgi:anti-sigma regulatory factor (Ser/Thr protein kinase)
MSGLSHELLLYEDDDRLVDGATVFLAEGLEAGEAVVTVLEARKLAILREALAPRAHDVTWIDVAGHYTRPEAAVADYDASVRTLVRDGAPRVRLFGELPTLESEAQCDAWIAYDAILNRAFDDQPVSVLCGYDGRVVPDRVVEAARRTHPAIHGDGPNADFVDPAEVVRAHTPTSQPLPGLRALETGDGASALRRALIAEMRAAGLAAEAIDGMVLAANEVLVNARRYAGGRPGIRAGRVGDGFVCEITDDGPGFDDPLAGYVPPRADRNGHGGGDRGAGLWIARQSTARLEVMRADDGLTVRLWA